MAQPVTVMEAMTSASVKLVMDSEKERAVEGKSGSAVISKGCASASGAMSRLVEILKRGDEEGALFLYSRVIPWGSVTYW
jgi:hypothetical protein